MASVLRQATDVALVSAAEDPEMAVAFALAQSEQIRERWFLRSAHGAHTLQGFSQWMHREAATHALVLDVTDERVLGHVVCYGLDLQNRIASLGFMSDPNVRRPRRFLRGLSLFINFVFDEYDLRKLYGEVIDYNYRQFRSGEGRWFQLEGTMRQHEYRRQQHWDVHLLAVYPKDAAAISSALGM